MRRLLLTSIFLACYICCRGQDSARTKTKIQVPVPASAIEVPMSIHLNYLNSVQTTKEILKFDQDQVKKIESAKLQQKQLSVEQLQQLQKAVNVASIFITPATIKPAVEVVTHLEDLPPNSKIVNGPGRYDSRVDVRSLDPSQPWTSGILKNTFSVGILVSRSKLVKISPSFYQIDDNSTLGTSYQLCPGEAFRDQPVVGTGTAFVTGKRQMLTAGHVFAARPSQYAVIFGFEIINKTGAYQKIIPADSVYFPVSIDKQSAELDIAIFSVDRDLKAPPLKWSAEANPPVDENVYMIGYPYGLPKKVSANAGVVSNNETLAFYTSLDAFAGNSGSPVFNLKTNEVIGVLVSGGLDFRWNGSCNISILCSIPYCQGEKAVRITAIKNLFNYGN